jgi:hypothetical protein
MLGLHFLHLFARVFSMYVVLSALFYCLNIGYSLIFSHTLTSSFVRTDEPTQITR